MNLVNDEFQETKLMVGGQRVYQIWPGRHRFYLNGKIMTGPVNDIGINTCVWMALLIVPTVIYSTTWNIMWNKTPLIPLSMIILQISSIVFLALVQSTEPGIIPTKNLQIKTGTQFYLVENLEHKKCPTCEIYRPPRTSHCSSCNSCITVYDHHCPFVNNCIGKRNYRYFFSFIVSIFSLLLTGSFTTIIMLTSYTDRNGNDSSIKSIFIILMIIIGFFTVVILLFCGFHIFLRFAGKTTKEALKKLTNADNSDQEFDWSNTTASMFDLQQIV